QRTFFRAARKRDRALKAKFTPEKVLDAMTANHGAGGAPLTPVELADVVMLSAASDAVAGGNGVPRRLGPPIQTATAADARWRQYLRLKELPVESLSDDDRVRIRLFEASASYR